MNETIYYPHHWRNITRAVADIALPIFPHIKGKKLKSEIMSNLFEAQSAKYFNSINIPTISAQNDKEPDLLFTDFPVEIKVTGIDQKTTKNAKWMGGKYSKRESDYIFVLWNYKEPITNYIIEEPENLSVAIIQCHSTIEDWKTIDNGNDNYYATVMTLDRIYDKPHRILLGNKVIDDMVLENTYNPSVDNSVYPVNK